jgi:hypothetical protein
MRFYLVVQHANCYRIRHQFAFINVGLGFQSQWRFISDFVTKQIARTDVYKLVTVHQFGSLGAFPGARRAKKYNIDHRLEIDIKTTA